MADSHDSSLDSVKGIPKLDETNFTIWQVLIQAALQEKKYWKYVSGDTPRPSGDGATKEAMSIWVENDQQARGFIIRCLSIPQLYLVQGKSQTAAETYRTICDAHEKTGIHSAFIHWKQLCATKYVDGEPVLAHINQLREHYVRLLGLGVTVPSELLAWTLLNSLPDSWSPFIMSLPKTEKLTFDSAAALIIDESRRRNGQSISESSALYGAKSFKNSSIKEVGQTTREPCPHCGLTNHRADKCFKKYPELRPNNKKQANSASTSSIPSSSAVTTSPSSSASSPNNNLWMSLQSMDSLTATGLSAASSDSSDSEFYWLIDSGASSHYCRHREWFDTFKPTTGNHVILGDGSRLPIIGHGTVRADTSIPGETSYVATLTNVQCVPDLKANLISVSSLTKHGLSITFADDKCIVRNDQGRTAGVAHRIGNNLYQLKVRSPFSPVMANVVTDNDRATYLLWHQRLGHVHSRALIQLFNDGMLNEPNSLRIAQSLKSYITNHPSKCEDCLYGKQHRRPIPGKATHRATAPLQLIHMDLCGPVPEPSHGGARYMYLIVDDYSRYIWMRPLKSKDETFNYFKEYVAWAENLHQAQGLRLQHVRSDNGGEFTSKVFDQYLISKGITRERTNPETPQQNGVAERANRTIFETTRTMLHAAKLDKPFWAEAASTAVYLRNLCPTKAVKGMTPYELWTGMKPVVSHLRPFGCLAYVHVSKSNRDKLDVKSSRGIFLGYSRTSRAWRVWDINSQSLIETRDVIFEETQLGIRNVGEGERLPPLPRVPMQNNSPSIPSTPAETISTSTPSNNPLPPGQPAESAVEDDGSEKVPPLIPPPTGLRPPAAEPNPLISMSSSQIKPPKLSRDLKQLRDFNSSASRDPAPSPVADDAHVSLALLTECWADTENEKALISSSSIAVDDDPRTLREALSRPERQQWWEACQKEFSSLQKAGTYRLVQLPQHRTAIGCKWVFKTKRGAHNEVVKLKARLVAKGYSQQPGIDFEETYAPVARYSSIRAVLSLVALYDWELHQMDVKSAYLNGELEEDIYMEQPEGFIVRGKEDWVCRLDKSLYGLKQAGRTWHQKIDTALKAQGFTPIQADQCIYVRRTTSELIIIALYVDDLLLASNHLPLLNKMKGRLASEFEMEDLGEALYVLGLEIKRDRAARALTISQSAYIRNLLTRHGMADCKPRVTPMEINARFTSSTGQAAPTTIKQYQTIIGGLMFAMICTRPDIAYAVTTLSQFSSNPNSTHIQAVKRVLHYLQGTIDHGITYRGSSTFGNINTTPSFVGYCDSDWGSCPDDRRSVTGYAFLCSDGAISWQSKKQKTVALSSVEAEYMAIRAAVQEAIWWRSFLHGLGYDITQPTTIYTDSQGSITLAKNPIHHDRTKHIDIQYHFTRHHVAEKNILLQYASTSEMPADGLTKPLGREKFVWTMNKLGVHTV